MEKKTIKPCGGEKALDGSTTITGLALLVKVKERVHVAVLSPEDQKYVLEILKYRNGTIRLTKDPIESIDIESELKIDAYFAERKK